MKKASKKKEVAPALGSIMLQGDRVFIWKNGRWFDAGYVLHTDLSITYSKGWEKGSEMPSGELTMGIRYDTHEFDHILNFCEKARELGEFERSRERDEFFKKLHQAQLNVQRAKEGKA